MIALTVVRAEKDKGIRCIFNRLKKDKISIEIKKARGVVVKHITYTSYNGKVNMNRLDRLIGDERCHIVCDESINFPKESGYKRFNSTAFAARLCTNMALFALSKCNSPEKLKIGLYDPKAASADFLNFILNLCSKVTVVTDNPIVYYEQLNIAMDELGATAVITKNRDELYNCDLIVAPLVIEEGIPIRENAVVLTAGKQTADIKGFIYSRFYFKMPNGFDNIKPAELNEEYFCSALYSLDGQYELGSIVPAICSDGVSSQTIKSLCAYLERLAENT